MKSKHFCLTIPTILLPYLTVITIFAAFQIFRCPFLKFLMRSVFADNVLYLVGTLILICIIAAAMQILFFVLAVKNRWDALSIAKTAMIIKLIQIPAYLVIFAIGYILFITIFTFPIALCLIVLDYFFIILTGLISAASVINTIRQGNFQFREVIWMIVLQHIFCADVIACIVFYSKLKKQYRLMQTSE